MRATIILAVACLIAAGLGCKKQTAEFSGHGHSHGAGGHEHPHEDGGEHGHEEKTAQITVWSGRYEIFAEHTAPVVGQPARFVTHVSDLHTGLPRKEGMVKFVLTQGAASFDHPQARPERAGIYIPAITFPSAGDWAMKIVIPGETNNVVEVGIIKVYPTADAAAHAAIPAAPEGISLLKEQQWRIALKIHETSRGQITNYVTAPATVIAAPGMSGKAYSAVAGRIVKQEALLGSKVEAGQLLGLVEPDFNESATRLVEARAEASRAKSQVEQAKRTFERVKSLHEERAKSDREFQEAAAALETAQANFEAGQSVLSLFAGAQTNGAALRVAIKSPVEGLLEAVHRNPGERVESNEPIYTVLNSSTLHIEARLNPSHLSDASAGLNALFTPPARPGSPQSVVPVQKVAVGQSVDPLSRLGRAIYKLEVNPGLAIGSFGTLQIPTSVNTNSVIVRSSSIVDEDGLPVAFVQLSGETFEKRDLVLGIQGHTWTEVKSGLVEGEQVVFEGAYPLLLSTKSGTIPAHGHAH